MVKNMERPILNKELDSKTFRDFYFLKEELVKFCKENGLPVSGGKIDITDSFQKWLKNNAGKSYREAITAYYQILNEKKKGKTTIDRQFEYNTYIRDFFADNKGKSLEDAIQSMLLGTFMLIPGIIAYY